MKADWQENVSITTLLLPGTYVELETGIYSVKTGDRSKTPPQKFRSIFMNRKN